MSDRQFPIENVQKALRRLLDESGAKPKPLSTELGLGPTAIRDVLLPKAKGVSTATLKIIADHFGVTVDEMLAGSATTSGVSTSARAMVSVDDDTVEIIALDLTLSMGPGTLIEEYPEEERVKISLPFVQAITRTPSDRLRLVRGIGDSMEPTLRTGDRVLVDINERQLARSHGVYWIDHLGTHGIKRLRPAGRGFVLVMSDNPLVPDFEVPAEELRIEGRVIWFARDL